MVSVKSALRKAKSFVGAHKGAFAVGAGVAGLGAAALGARKLLKGRGTSHHRRSSVSRLKSQVMRLSLKIKKQQLQRKLFREETRM